MFTWKTINENYFNPVFKNNYQYIESEIRQIFQGEGVTAENKHDLWKCLLDTEEYDIPYRSVGRLNARIAYFFTDLYYIIFQKRILKKAIKELCVGFENM